MITKLVEGYATAFPMWEILLGTAGIVVIFTFHFYKKEGSIHTAILLQFLWFLVPVFVIISEIEQCLKVAGHIGSGIMLGIFLAVWLYTTGMGLKKLHRGLGF